MIFKYVSCNITYIYIELLVLIGVYKWKIKKNMQWAVLFYFILFTS